MLLQTVQFGKVLLCPLDFSPDAVELKGGEGSLCKGWGAADCFVQFGGSFVCHAGEALHGFVLAIVGVHGFALVQCVLETLQTVL